MSEGTKRKSKSTGGRRSTYEDTVRISIRFRGQRDLGVARSKRSPGSARPPRTNVAAAARGPTSAGLIRDSASGLPPGPVCASASVRIGIVCST